MYKLEVSIVKARDLIKPGENVVVIFTHGGLFKLHEDNTGSTGNWIVDPSRCVDRVIVYFRDKQINTNTLYIANHAGLEAKEKKGRYNIQLNHVQYIGATSLNWYEFADGSQNPIRYLP